MQVALYRGIATISGDIERLTRSVYSHTAVWFPEQLELWEAVGAGFVQARSLGENHEAGTIVDLLEYKTPLTVGEEAVALAAARGLAGTPYDYVGIAAFALKLGVDPGAAPGPSGEPSHVFCSTGVFIVCAAMGPERVLLERTLAWKVAPEDINKCPLLKWVGSVTL